MTQRIIKYTVYSLAVLSLLLLILLFTRPGLHIAYYLAKTFVPGQLYIAELQGSNLAHFQAKLLDYQSDTQRISIKKVMIDWSPSRFLFGRLNVNKLDVKKIKVTELKSSDSKLSWSQLRDIRIRHANINDVTWIDIDGHLHRLDSIQLDSNSEAEFIQLNKLKITGKRFQLSGLGKIDQRLATPLDFKCDLNLQRFDKIITGKAHIYGNWQQLTIHADLDQPFATELRGEIDLSTHSPQINLNAKWELLAWPLTGKPIIELNKGSLSFHGPLEDYKVTIDSELQTPYLPQARITGTGHGSLQEIEIPQFNINTLNGEITGQIKLLSDPLSWELHLLGRDINPGKFWHGWHGNLSLELSGSGGEGTHSAHYLELNSLSGQLHQQPINGQGAIEFSQHRFQIKNFRVQMAKNHITVNGGYDKTWNLTWAIDIPDLAQFQSHAKGLIKSQGTINQNQINSQTVVRNVSYHHFNLQELDIKSTGNFKRQQVLLDFVHDEDNGHIELNGYQRDNGLQLTIPKANFKFNQYPWQLQSPIKIQLVDNHLTVARSCWQVQASTLCFSGQRSAVDQWKTNVNISKLATSALPIFTPELQVDSQLNLNLLASRDHEKVAFNLKANLHEGKIKFKIDDEEHEEPIKAINLTAQLNPSGFQASVNGELGAKKTVVGEFDLPDFYGRSRPLPNNSLRGFIKIHFPDLDLIANLLPQVKDLNGSGKLGLDLSGTIAEPHIKGNLSVANAKATLPLLGVDLTNINLDIRGRGSNELDYQGQAHSGKGAINFKGTTKFKDKTIATNTILQGSQFALINTDEYKITVDPNLTIQSLGKDISLDGKLAIPKAHIAPRDFSHTVEMPMEVVYVDQATPEVMPFKVTSDVNIALGEKVTLDILGIRGRIGGQVHIKDNPQTPTVANGEIEIFNGKYEAYGRNLQIKHGALLFTGGRINNPGLNIQAQREIVTQDESRIIPSFSNDQLTSIRPTSAATFTQQTNRFTVGVNITGTLEKPDVKLFSSPVSMADAEILSYLILNRSTAQLQSSEAGPNHNTLLNAIPALGLSSDTATRVTHELQHTLGLDQIEITGTGDPLSSNLADTSISIGKAISHRLYVSYTYGLLNAKNALRIRYLLSRRWTIQTEAMNDADSSAKSVDFIYSIAK